MKFIKILILLTGLSTILNSCGSFKEVGQVMRNQKTKTTDEFLIQKKEPLTQPPDFQNLPKPKTTEDNTEQNSFEKILRAKKSKSKSNQTKSSSTEESILNQIKK